MQCIKHYIIKNSFSTVRMGEVYHSLEPIISWMVLWYYDKEKRTNDQLIIIL